MACKGECSKQETEVRNISVDKITPDPANAPTCPKKPTAEVINQTVAALRKELEGIVNLVECTGRGCDCSGKWGEWGDWLKGEWDKAVTVGECKYTVTFKYEIRGRKYSGVCVSTRGSSR